MYSERPLNCPVVYTTDRSKAVVPMLFLLYNSVVYIARRFILILPSSLSMCFVCPFSILITLLGEEGTGLCVYRAFVC